MYRIAPGRLGSARDFDHPRHSHSPTTQGLSLHCTGDLVFQHSGARDRLTIPDTAHSAHTTLPGVIPMVVGAVFQHSGGRHGFSRVTHNGHHLPFQDNTAARARARCRGSCCCEHGIVSGPIGSTGLLQRGRLCLIGAVSIPPRYSSNDHSSNEHRKSCKGRHRSPFMRSRRSRRSGGQLPCISTSSLT